MKVLELLKYIFQFLTGVGVDKTLQSQAGQVRDIARQLPLNVFPEILNNPQDCPVCKKQKLLIIHPDLICYSCFMDVIHEARQEAENQ